MNLTINGLPIAVDQAAVEEIIRKHLLNGDEAVRPIALPGTAHIPQLGKGETYIGSYCGPDGKLTHTILLPQRKDGLDFDSTLTWSREQLPNQESDAPNRIEALMLFLHHRALFEKDDVLWTNEQSAADSSYAWLQSFSNGNQYYWHKASKYLARAVRRVTI